MLTRSPCLLVTLSALALAQQARGQSPQQPGKAPPFASPPPMLMYVPSAHGGGPERPLYHLVRTDPPRSFTWGPGPVGKTLAWGGRRLQWFDRGHTWTIGHSATMPTALSAPVAPFTPPHFGPTQFGDQTLNFFAVPVAVPVASPPPMPTARATPQHAMRDEEAPPAPPAPAMLLPKLAVPPSRGDIAVIPWDH